MAILAGMPPVGVTEDATDLDGLPADVETVGTPAKPSLEKIVALEPTLVLITAEVPTQKELESSLDSAGIAWRDVDVNNFDDYATHMAALTEMSGRDDLYQANVTDVSDAIAKVEESAADLPQVSYLALLVSSTKAKVAKSDYFACEIFDNLQMANVAEDDSSLDDLSVEAIVAADSTYVFVIPRGDEDKAKEVFEQDFQAQPAWASLSAVQAGRINVLPKDLFEYKPNERWAEAYSYILNLREQEGVATWPMGERGQARGAAGCAFWAPLRSYWSRWPRFSPAPQPWARARSSRRSRPLPPAAPRTPLPHSSS